jgi:hypothetical protein
LAALSADLSLSLYYLYQHPCYDLRDIYMDLGLSLIPLSSRNLGSIGVVGVLPQTSLAATFSYVSNYRLWSFQLWRPVHDRHGGPSLRLQEGVERMVPLHPLLISVQVGDKTALLPYSVHHIL